MDVIEKPIYKFAHIGRNNNIKILYVFIGENANKMTSDALDRLFIQKPTDEAFKGVFTEDEINELNEMNPIPKIKFIPESIHLDDTIETIKKKFLFQLMDDLNTSYDELYFYIRQTPSNCCAATVRQTCSQDDCRVSSNAIYSTSDARWSCRKAPQ